MARWSVKTFLPSGIAAALGRAQWHVREICHGAGFDRIQCGAGTQENMREATLFTNKEIIMINEYEYWFLGVFIS